MNLVKAAIVQLVATLALKLWPHAEEHVAKNRKVAAGLFYFLLIIAVAALFVGCLAGCSLIEQRLDPSVYYKRDIELTINGQKYKGIAVPAKAPEYKLEIEGGGGAEINMLTATSCHREITVEGSAKKYAWTYRPIKGLEDGMGCLLEIGAYNKQGRHSWATIDFLTGSETLAAEIQCNGGKLSSQGVSICQAKAGLTQKIIFSERVKVSPDPGCAPMRTKDEKTFEYEITKGECPYYFATREGKLHRHSALGYESILIREAAR